MTAFFSNLCSRLILTVILFGSLFASDAGAEGTIRIGGVGSSMGSMQILAHSFEQSNPGYKIVIIPGLGSSGAVAAVHRGALDIGIVGRPLRDSESNLGLNTVDYARTPFVIVVRKDVEATAMTHDDLVDIYRGEKKFWPNGKLLRLILRPPTDADSVLIRRISPALNAALDSALSRPGMIQAITDQENAELIEKTPGAAGFSTLTQVLAERRNLKILEYNGAAPSVKALQSGTYPFYKTLTFVTKNNRSTGVTLFINFMKSKNVRQKLVELGNLPLEMK